MKTENQKKNIINKRSQSPLKVAKGYIISHKSEFLNGAALFVALIYGWIGCNTNNRMEMLAKKQDSTSVTIDTFKKLLLKTDVLITQQSQELVIYKEELTDLKHLLTKTDTVITLSGSQLELNRQQQGIANKYNRAMEIADMNKLAFDCRVINRYASAELVMHQDIETETKTEKFNRQIRAFDTILQMMDKHRSNTFLNGIDALNLQWMNACESINNIKILLKNLNGKWYSQGQINEGVPQSDSIELKKSFLNCWELIMKAIISAGDSVNANKIHKGYPIVFRQGDIVTLKTNKKIKYTVISDDIISGKYMCRKAPIGLTETVYFSPELLEIAIDEN